MYSKKIAVVGTTNMDMVIKTKHIPAPGAGGECITEVVILSVHAQTDKYCDPMKAMR